MRRFRLTSPLCLALAGAGCGGTTRHVAHGPLFAGNGGICASKKAVRFSARSDVPGPPPTVCDGVTPRLRALLRTMPPGLVRVLPALSRIGRA